MLSKRRNYAINAVLLWKQKQKRNRINEFRLTFGRLLIGLGGKVFANGSRHIKDFINGTWYFLA